MTIIRHRVFPLSKILLSLALICIFTISARADILNFSEAEKVGFAFYQLAGIEPNFKSWIVNSEAYKNARPVEKDQMLHEDLTRLRNGYYGYVPDQNLVEVDLTGMVHVSNYFGASQSEGVTTKVRIRFDDIPEKFIPFQIGDMWIAVVAQDLEKLLDQEMDRQEYKNFASRLNLSKRTFSLKEAVNISMKLRPLSIDGEEPIMLEGLPMWLMLAEIGSFEVWIDGGRGERRYAFEHHADWYVPNEQRMMLDLYDR